MRAARMLCFAVVVSIGGMLGSAGVSHVAAQSTMGESGPCDFCDNHFWFSEHRHGCGDEEAFVLNLNFHGCDYLPGKCISSSSGHIECVTGLAMVDFATRVDRLAHSPAGEVAVVEAMASSMPVGVTMVVRRSGIELSTVCGDDRTRIAMDVPLPNQVLAAVTAYREATPNIVAMVR